MQVLLLFALFAASPGNRVVITPVANMFSGPAEDTDVVSQAIYATNVEVLEQNGSWMKVRTPDAYSGWMQSGALLRSAPYATTGRVAHVEGLFANLYRETDVTKHQPLLTVPYETALEIVSDEGPRWFRVRLPDDRSAYVQRGDVALERKPLPVTELVEFSKKFVGLPYLWGGTSTFGYDCSGYVQMLYRRHGVVLPRDAQPQAEWSGVRPVEKNELRPGDLLYFGPSAGRITHTGMYLGDGRFINATTHEHPVVQISELNDAHWSKLFVAARRLK